ncbi:MAG: tetratricopeptide repeat protein [Stellaceae bacterium]
MRFTTRAICTSDKGRLDQAVALLGKALAQRPDSAEAHNAIGAAFEMLMRHEEAIAHYRRALTIRPDRPEVLGNLGNVLITTARLAEAVTCLEKAVALKPDLAAAQHNLGRALFELGHLDEACRHFETAVVLEPKRGMHYRWLANAKRFETGDAELAAMEALAHDIAALPSEDQIELHFALGKAYADSGREESAFSHLITGNRLKRQQIVYDEAEALRAFDRIRAVFTREVMQSRVGSGDPSGVPVFILGMPRSGTTLVEQILASHPPLRLQERRQRHDDHASITTAISRAPRTRRSQPVWHGARGSRLCALAQAGRTAAGRRLRWRGGWCRTGRSVNRPAPPSDDRPQHSE